MGLQLFLYLRPQPLVPCRVMGDDLAAFLQDVPEQADPSHLSVIPGLQEDMTVPSPFPVITFIQIEADQIPVSRDDVPCISGTCLQDFMQLFLIERFVFRISVEKGVETYEGAAV